MILATLLISILIREYEETERRTTEDMEEKRREISELSSDLAAARFIVFQFSSYDWATCKFLQSQCAEGQVEQGIWNKDQFKWENWVCLVFFAFEICPKQSRSMTWVVIDCKIQARYWKEVKSDQELATAERWARCWICWKLIDCRLLNSLIKILLLNVDCQLKSPNYAIDRDGDLGAEGGDRWGWFPCKLCFHICNLLIFGLRLTNRWEGEGFPGEGERAQLALWDEYGWGER